MNLTPKQLEVACFIRDETNRNGYAPTIKEMALALYCSKVTVFEHIEELVKKGVVVRDGVKRGMARPWRVAKRLPDETNMRFPIIGAIR